MHHHTARTGAVRAGDADLKSATPPGSSTPHSVGAARCEPTPPVDEQADQATTETGDEARKAERKTNAAKPKF